MILVFDNKMFSFLILETSSAKTGVSAKVQN